MSSQPVIIVGGPTASGKSKLGVLVAKKFGGEIINADAMQMYGDLKIVTGRPSAADQAYIPHHLYGILGLHQRANAGSWREAALAAIHACHRASKIPILVGGTGLYLRFLLSGMHRMPNVPTGVRARLNERLEREGTSVLHAELAAVDPRLAGRLDPADSQRIVRGLEIFQHTGKCMSAWQSAHVAYASPNLAFLTTIIMPNREELYAAINNRLDKMLEAGAVEEVEHLIAAGPDPDYPPLKAVGVPPIRSFLARKIDENRMLELAKRDTRRYAKRQYTWFKNQIVPDITLQKQHMINTHDKFFSEISKFLLTV